MNMPVPTPTQLHSDRIMLLSRSAADQINRQIAQLVEQVSECRATCDIPEHLFSTDRIRLNARRIR